MGLFCKCFGTVDLPILSGPLLAPYREVIPLGHFMIRSYTYVTLFSNDKNEKTIVSPSYTSIVTQFQTFFGLTPFCDLSLTPQICYNFSKNGWAINFCDLPIGLDFQILSPTYTTYFPGIKFSAKEIFPTGHYNHLKPCMANAASSGLGSFRSQFELVFYKLFHPLPNHYLSLNCSFQYTLSQPVHVFGFNAYGGGFGSKGTVLPGNLFKAFLSFEFTLSKHLALTLDNVYKHQDRSDFIGKDGISFDGKVRKTRKPSSEEFSMAPAIAYNYSHKLSIVAGVWAPVFRRNCENFISSIINIQYIY